MELGTEGEGKSRCWRHCVSLNVLETTTTMAATATTRMRPLCLTYQLKSQLEIYRRPRMPKKNKQTIKWQPLWSQWNSKLQWDYFPPSDVVEQIPMPRFTTLLNTTSTLRVFHIRLDLGIFSMTFLVVQLFSLLDQMTTLIVWKGLFEKQFVQVYESASQEEWSISLETMFPLKIT